VKKKFLGKLGDLFELLTPFDLGGNPVQAVVWFGSVTKGTSTPPSLKFTLSQFGPAPVTTTGVNPGTSRDFIPVASLYRATMSVDM
jgi:hypothetical protein